MNDTLRRFALRGLESQKQGLALRLKQAAVVARETAGGGHGVAGGAAGWLAGRLDSAALAIEGRDVEQWLREAQALARRHPLATAAVTAAAAFALTRLARPANGRPRVPHASRREGTYA